MKTALHESHVALGARMVEFGGWHMPVQYAGILQEHAAVRTRAGLFDISHMGEIEVEGENAVDFINYLFTNDASRLQVGEGQYTLMCTPVGGVIDDLYVFRIGEEKFYLVVNASRVEEDFSYVRKFAGNYGVEVSNVTASTGALALQGPVSAEIMQGVVSESLPEKNGIKPVRILEVNCWLTRTGYTGEDGFELFFPGAKSEILWKGLLEAGRDLGLVPCGLGCRDTLRLEACFPLYGHELTKDMTPVEAGLLPFLALYKEDFIGKQALSAQKLLGVKWKLVGFKMKNPGGPPPRAHYKVFSGAHEIGEVTSGTLSPSLKWGIGLAYVESGFAKPGQPLEIEVRGNRVEAEVVKKPFIQKK
ncbi:MAG: glycine cleavage system aminomethyltransferase GcvT [Verrucomicrobiae bacterium]|nr:glycine cleavage system aminomethyltransferase GcvT [Verrucomicrobiae bacterium]